MASQREIQFDFEQAKRQARRIDEIADYLSNLSRRKLEDAFQELSKNWRGENASAYLAKGGSLQEDIDETAKNLHIIALDIRSASKRIYDAEMTALRTAEAREHEAGLRTDAGL